MTRFFLNQPETLVSEAVDGFLCSSNTPVAMLNLGDGVNVVVRPDWSQTKADSQVALITGGGSGHEPMHAGFVGAGMLTAAVCGGLFASPSIDAVLSAILHCAGAAGVLVIVKAYTGDCLNFGLAVEKARSMGVRCEMVVFSDDVSIPDHPRPRGLAGTVLLHKILGYFAEKRRPLEELRAIADKVIADIATIGVSITSCRLPTSTDENRIEGGHAELGLGIHGEPGVQQIDTQNVKKVVTLMVEKLAARVKGTVAVLLNNLGGVSELEMNVICSTLLKIDSLQISHLVGPAALCTSLDMKGFSITFLGLSKNPEFEKALVEPVEVHGWVPANPVHPALVLPPRNQFKGVQYKASANESVKKMITAVCETLIAKESELNDLDKAVGDGDTGLTFSTGCRRLLAELPKMPLADLASLFMNISEILSKGMGGSSGVLLAIAAVETGNSIKAGKSVHEALLSGVHKMMALGGAKPGMRTMIDALLPAVTALPQGLEAAAKAAEDGVEATKKMERAGAGRSSYLNSQSLIGHADPGAQAIALAFRALASLEK